MAFMSTYIEATTCVSSLSHMLSIGMICLAAVVPFFKSRPYVRQIVDERNYYTEYIIQGQQFAHLSNPNM